MYIYTHAHTHKFTYTHAHIRICTHTCSHILTHIPPQTHAHTYMHMFKNAYAPAPHSYAQVSTHAPDTQMHTYTDTTSYDRKSPLKHSMSPAVPMS